jgi:hypothetical protein
MASVSLVAPVEEPSYIDDYSLKESPTLYCCIWPRFLVRGRDWRHRCRTVGTISQYRICLEPVITLPNPSQGLDTELAS